MDAASFLGAGIIFMLVVFLAILLSSLPLYLSVAILGGRASILKVFFTNILVAIIAVFAFDAFGFGALAIVLFSVLLYMLMFRLGIIRALFAWLLQYIIAGLLLYLALLLGISMPFYIPY